MDLAERLRQRRNLTGKSSSGSSGNDRGGSFAQPAHSAGSAPSIASPETDNPGTESGILPFDLDGWHQLSEHLWSRELSFSVPEFQSLCSVKSLADEHNEIFSRLVRKDDLDLLFRDISGLLFFDIETTGLSGGAGTTIFLLGAGCIEDQKFRLVQWFASDYPGESDLLQHFADFCSTYTALVSYNGRSFDWPLLQTKAIMSGVDLPVLPHIDLLYPCRRLYRYALPDCSLSTIEREVLGIKRDIDIPGREVPMCYSSFLASNNAALMTPVFAHHVQDICSLQQLFDHLRCLVYPEPVFRSECDLRNLASFAAAAGHNPVDILQAGMDRFFSEECTSAHTEMQLSRSARLLLWILKRQGRWSEAVDLLTHLQRISGEKDCFYAVELSKIFEHRLKDYRAALHALQNSVSSDKISYRRQRLERKMSSRIQQ